MRVASRPRSRLGDASKYEGRCTVTGAQSVGLGLCGYNVGASIRDPNKPCGQYAFEHWLSYRRMVSGGYPWRVGDKVVIYDFGVHGNARGWTLKAIVTGVNPNEDIAGMADYSVRVTGTSKGWYDRGEILSLRGCDIRSR